MFTRGIVLNAEVVINVFLVFMDTAYVGHSRKGTPPPYDLNSNKRQTYTRCNLTWITYSARCGTPCFCFDVCRDIKTISEGKVHILQPGSVGLLLLHAYSVVQS